MKHWKHYIPEGAFTLLSLFIGAIGSLLTRMGMPAYDLAQKPWFTPPSWVFPVVWTVLYILMGIGMGRVWKRGGPRLQGSLWLFGVQLMLNLFWTVWFFPLQLYGIAFGWLLLLLGTVAAMTRSFHAADETAAALQYPYLLWLLLAAVLNYSVWIMNK